MNLYGSKDTCDGDISVNILKSTADIHLPYITNIVNLSIEDGHLPDKLKLAEVSPVFRKKDELEFLFYLMCQRSLKESYNIK